jgi:hypothetical protein
MMPSPARAGDPLKPYVVLVLDTSGSMGSSTSLGGGPTGAGPTSCGTSDNKLNHAKCAINKIANSYGDMVFSLARFRTDTGGTPPNSCTTDNDVCTAFDDSFEMLAPLIDGDNDLVARWTDNTLNTCLSDNTMDPEIFAAPNNTPIGGSLLGAKDYWLGLQYTVQPASGTGDAFAVASGVVTLTDSATSFDSDVVGMSITITGATNPANNGTFTITSRPFTTGRHQITWDNAAAVAESYSGAWTISSSTTIWPSTSPGFDPIANDPTNLAFLARPDTGTSVCNSVVSGPNACDDTPECTGEDCCCLRQCRPYITIMLTDGAENCDGDGPAAAISLLDSDKVVGGETRRYRVETRAIGFGDADITDDIEALAHAGGVADDGIDNTLEGLYAKNEADLQLAISSILADAIRTETCNDLDDDCDIKVDEDFADKGGACTNNGKGICRVAGEYACRVDGTGVACTWPPTTCTTAGDACTVTNVSGDAVAGVCASSPAGMRCEPQPQTEVCNGKDDNCNGLVDEGLDCGPSCIPQNESCNNEDDDCDGDIDEELTRGCGIGVCTGVETCTAGVWDGCTATTPVDEDCNGIDDNCDGVADNFQAACSNLTDPVGCGAGTCNTIAGVCMGGGRDGLPCGTFPALDPRNNPNTGICQPGARQCTPASGGTWSACVGEVGPATEICNGQDDDCDGAIDETPTTTCATSADCPPITPTCDTTSHTCQPADCSVNNCGGQLVCQNGVPTCTQVTGTDDNCNGIDEDCDGTPDDDWQCADPDGPDGIAGNADDCPCTDGGICNGHESCENGGVVCLGTPMGVETCNCADDDCDGTVDNGTCGDGAEGPPGSACKACQCAFPCQGGEFPCPLGKACVTLPGDTQGYCLADPCYGVTCPDVAGDKQVCRTKAGNLADHECVSACDPSVIQCPTSLICFGPTGECRPDDCTTFPDRCSDQQLCINGECVTNLCLGVDCPADQYCVAGQCYGTCAGVECPDGERCRMGQCGPDPCGAPCPFGQICHDETGECIADPCEFVNCPQGQWCDPNSDERCQDDPCLGTTCPNEGEVCRGGTCYAPSEFAPDAAIEQHVSVGGGGGCNAGGDAGLGLGLALLLMRRRRAKGGAS